MSKYAFGKTVAMPQEQAIQAVTQALAQEGFGVLTEIDVAATLKKKLGIGYGETTADGKFTLKEGECMGACGDAPVMIVNNRSMCSHMHPEQIDKLLEECK